MNRDTFHVDVTGRDVSGGRVMTGLRSDVSDVDRELMKAERTSDRVANGLRNATIAATAFAAAAAIGGRAASDALDYADAVDKAAISTGIGREAIQEYTFAGEQLGVSTDFLISSLDRFNKRLADVAATGSGPGADGFKELGLAQKFASGEIRNTEEALDFALRRLAEYETSGERAAIAADLFGSRAGPEMAKLLAEGMEGLERWRDGAEVVSDDVIRNSVAIRDEWTAMTSNMSTQFKGFVLETITGWQQIFNLFSGDIGGRTDIDLLGDSAEIGRDLAQARLRLRELEDQGFGGGAEAQNIRDTIGPLRERLDVLDAEMQRRKDLKSLRETLSEEPAGGVAPRGGGGGGRSIADEEERARQSAADQLDSLIAKQAEWVEAKKFELSLIGREPAAIQAANDEREVAARLMERRLLAIDAEKNDSEYIAYLEELAEEERAVAAAIREKSAAHEADARAAEAAQRATEEMAASLSQTFASIRNEKDLLFGLGSLAIEGLFGQGAFGSIGNSLFGVEAGGITGLFNAKGNAFGSSGVQAFAKGDVFNAPTAFQFGRGELGIMGEAGPEVVAPLKRDASGNMGVGAVAPVVNVRVETHTSRPVEAKTFQNGSDLEIQIMEIVADGVNEVGSPIDVALNARGV